MDSLKTLARLFDGKRVLIAGFGREGQSSYRLIRKIAPDVFLGVADRDPHQAGLSLLEGDPRLALHVGPGYLDRLDDYDLILRAPGISYSGTHLAEHRAKITSQTDLFLEACPGRIIGVTGTKGKSTCASLIHAVLEGHTPNAHLLGNIGRPALDTLGNLDADSLIVYELSSHQLMDVHRAPHVSILLNVFPEHMDYYEHMADYVRAKTGFLRHATPHDTVIYNASFPELRDAAGRSRARSIAYTMEPRRAEPCWWDGERILYSSGGKDDPVISVRDILLPGVFNLNNVIPAVIACKLLGVPTDRIRQAVARFRPIEHRLELVGTFHGVTFYNDSISTIPECTMAALDVFGDRLGSIILGGHDRKRDFRALAEALARCGPDALILFPATGAAIERAVREEPSRKHLHTKMFPVKSMEEAVRVAFDKTPPGKVCLLSPASPSFGLFKDFAERGTLFKTWVRRVADRLSKATQSKGVI